MAYAGRGPSGAQPGADPPAGSPQTGGTRTLGAETGLPGLEHLDTAGNLLPPTGGDGSGGSDGPGPIASAFRHIFGQVDPNRWAAQGAAAGGIAGAAVGGLAGGTGEGLAGAAGGTLVAPGAGTVVGGAVGAVDGAVKGALVGGAAGAVAGGLAGKALGDFVVYMQGAGGSGSSRTSGSRQASNDPIQDATNSPDPNVRLEGTAARDLRNAGVNINSFQRKIGPNGSIGEIDIETNRTIIEVTSRESGKLGQIDKLLTNTQINPTGKPVILYAPNYGGTAGQAILNRGAYVARNPTELLELVRRFGG